MSDEHKVRDRFGEMVMVVASILIAFAVDAGWDRYQEAREEHQILLDLRDDFGASLAGLEERWLPLHQGALDATRDLLWLTAGNDGSYPRGPWSGPEPWLREFALRMQDSAPVDASRTVVVPENLVGKALLTATYDPTLATLDTLLQSAALEKISDRALRQALAEMPADLADLADEERLARAHVYEQLRPLLQGTTDIVVAEVIGYGWIEADPPLPALATDRTLALPVTRELRNVLAARNLTQGGVRSEARALAASMREILTLLDEQLAAR